MRRCQPGGPWLLPEDLSDRAIVLRDRLVQAGEALIAPSLLTTEVTSTLSKAIHRQRVPSALGEEAFQAFRLFPIYVYDLAPLMDDAWAWAKALNAPNLYDMYYLALAEREGCDLWTRIVA